MSNKIKLLIIVLLFQFIPTSVIAGKHALLIGIQDYSKTGFHSLAGPANDLKLTETVLRQRFGFQDADFIILKDKMATHTGIQKAFTKLIKRVKPNDFVYIFYSGHGSRTVDLNGDEQRSGLDQTWVSYGSRTSNPDEIDNYDVLDDEINAWLAKLYEKTEVVFISDSCHSATVSRGSQIRAVKNDKRDHLLGKRNYHQLTKHRGIRIGAARDSEFALDFPQINGEYYGLFTWHWLQSLQQAQAGETWNDVFKRTYVQVTQSGIVQQPQMSGNSRKAVLGGGFTPQPPTIPVHVAYSDWVGIQAGALSGVTKGSVYRLYKPSNSQKRASLTITEVTPFKSFGRPKGTFQQGDLVVEKSHAYHFPPLKVYLEADKNLFKPIQAIFARKELSAYQLVSKKSDDIDLYLKLSGSNISIQTIEERLFHKKLQIKFDKLKNGLKWLQSTLRKMARARELILLQSRSTLPITVQISILSKVKSCPNSADCMRISNQWYHKTGPYNLEELGDQSLNKGQILTFSLSNQSKKTDYYAYLINITPDLAIKTIFPAIKESMEFARINQGETRKLRTALGLKPIGEETLKLIISNKPIDAYLFTQEPVEGILRGRGLNPLEQLLNKAVHGQRGDSLIEIDEWATRQVSFKVK